MYRLVGAGELCWVRVCGRRRVTTAEINRFIDAHTESASWGFGEGGEREWLIAHSCRRRYAGGSVHEEGW